MSEPPMATAWITGYGGDRSGHWLVGAEPTSRGESHRACSVTTNLRLETHFR